MNKLELASNLNTPAEVLAELAKDGDLDVKTNVADNPNTPEASLAELAKDEDWRVRYYTASNPNTPVESLAELAKDEDWLVRSCAASNPNTPAENLVELSKDSDIMLQKYLNKDGALTLIAQKKLISLENGFEKLSKFYNSRSTKCASVLFSDLFVRIYDKETIISKRFDCRVRCIISPNFENPHVIEFFKQLNIERKKAQEFKREEKSLYDLQVKACKKEIKSNCVIQKFIKDKREKGEKDRTIAWKLSSSTRKPNLRNFSIKVILNSI